jgi:hypothetical protein
MRLGWHIYAQQWVRGKMDYYTTDFIFYVHPSGSWVFYTSQLAFDGNGTVGLAHSPWGYQYHLLNTYDYYDVAKVEQPIIDIVHISFGTAKQPKTFRSSLRALYNLAAKTGEATNTEAFDQIQESDLRFELTKSEGAAPTDWPNIVPMKLSCRAANTTNWYSKVVGECIKDNGAAWPQMGWAATQPQGDFPIDGTISPFDFLNHWTYEPDPTITRHPSINEFPCRFATPRLYDR